MKQCHTAISPLNIVQPGDIVYTVDGKCLPAEKLSNGLHSSKVLLTVSGTGSPKENLEKAKAFCRRYIMDNLQHILDTKEGSIEKLFDTLEARSHLSAEQQLANLQAEVEKRLDQITVEKLENDLHSVWEKGETLRHQGTKNDDDWMDVTLAEVFAEGGGQDIAQTLTSRFASHMPEWMQVLVHHYGCHITTTADFATHTSRRGHAESSTETAGCFNIFLPTQPQIKRTSEDRIHTMREELLHSLQQRSDNIVDKAYERNFDYSCGVPPSPPSLRFYDAAESVIKAIDANPNMHPALQLIKNTEPKGGSLMSKKMKDDTFWRAGELLVDVYDAETYLLTKEKKNSEETKVELIRCFGQEVYDGSREYLKHWMDTAQELLKEKIGEKRANGYRQKWEHKPLTHYITLHKEKGYDLAQGLSV